MPITQDRMIAVLEAATNLVDHHIKIYDAAEKSYSTNNFAITEALSDLDKAGIKHPAIERLVRIHDDFAADMQKITSSSPSSVAAIAQERGHFNSRRKSNDRARITMREGRARRAERDSDQEMTKPIRDAVIDINDLHNKIFAIYSQLILRDPNAVILARAICDTITSMGQGDITVQLALLTQLETENRITQATWAGSYHVAAPSADLGTPMDLSDPDETGGLLPDRVIGLRRRTE
jgi:hypothetical protein